MCLFAQCADLMLNNARIVPKNAVLIEKSGILWYNVYNIANTYSKKRN